MNNCKANFQHFFLKFPAILTHGSASTIRIRIPKVSHNANPCRFGSMLLINRSRTSSRVLIFRSDSCQVPTANMKATGKEWTSSGPILEPEAKASLGKKKKGNVVGMKTPSGGTIRHDSDGEEDDGGTAAIPADFFDGGAAGSSSGQAAEDDATLPEGFFDDPVQDAKARGIEYKVGEANLPWGPEQKHRQMEVHCCLVPGILRRHFLKK